jgi:hypothetical protein
MGVSVYERTRQKSRLVERNSIARLRRKKKKLHINNITKC